MNTATQNAVDHRPIIDGWDFLDISGEASNDRWEAPSRKESLQIAGFSFCAIAICLFIAGIATLSYNVTPKPANVPAAISTQR